MNYFFDLIAKNKYKAQCQTNLTRETKCNRRIERALKYCKRLKAASRQTYIVILCEGKATCR